MDEPDPDCDACGGSGETLWCVIYGECNDDGCEMTCPCVYVPAKEQRANV